jgi:hypothetical protein
MPTASSSSSLLARAATFLLLLLVPLGTACGGSDNPGGTADAVSCAGAPPECCGADADGCSALVGSATCTGGAWTCPGSDTLAGAGYGVCDSTCSTVFHCGSGDLACNPTTQYCLLVHGEQADAGAGASCVDLPTGCASDEPDAAAICSCIGVGDSCVDDDGFVTVTAEAL